MYFLEIDLRINTTINFKDFKYALEKYELDFDWESGFNEFWDTKNDFGRIFETYEIKENLGGRLPLKIVSFNGKSLFNGDIEKFISELKLFSKYFVGKWVGYFDYEDFRYFGNNFERENVEY